MKKSELRQIIKEEISKVIAEGQPPLAKKTDKFLLFRKASSSPSPGHPPYLFASGNTLDDLFDNWLLTMQAGGYGYKGQEVERERKRFDAEREKYWMSPASFYTLKIK
jgi:hypothetical protein